MDIRENILNHSEFVKLNADKVANEQDTKRVLVIPFLEDVLGIRSRDPHDLRSEYPADWGDRNHKAVDYALMFDEKPLVIIEVKMARRSLDGDPLTQLRGYFSAIPEAKFGILTDGIKYRFYADLDDSKGLDTEPFLEIDLSYADEPRVAEIERFHKKGFDADQVWDWAKRTQRLSKWQGAITDRLKSEMADPSDGFVRFMMDKVNAGRKTGGRIEEFRGYIKSAVSELGSVVPANEGQSQPPPPALEGNWVLFSTVDSLFDSIGSLTVAKPKEIQFPNDTASSVAVEHWYEVWMEFAKFLGRHEEYLSSTQLPLTSSVRSKPILGLHEFSQTCKRAGGSRVFYEDKGNSHLKLKWTEHLAKQLNVGPIRIRLKH